jgi:hypothetical protein
MQLTFTNDCDCDQLFAELVEAGCPVLAVYRMDNRTTRVAVQDWARVWLVNAVVVGHVPGTYHRPTTVVPPFSPRDVIDGGLL